MRSASTSPIIVLIVVTVVAWLSFALNMFRVVDTDTFEHYQNGSERLVVEGINRVRLAPELSFTLGRFDSGLFAEQPPSGVPALSREFIDGPGAPSPAPFIVYESQFGLQGFVWRQIADTTGASKQQLRTVNASVLALVVGGLAACVAAGFGGLAAGLVAASLVLSPMVNAFARDLYWISWSWFLPTLIVAVAVLISVRSESRPRLGPFWLFLYGLALLVKFLSGYEYASSIVMASMVPLAIATSMTGGDWGTVLRRCVALGMVSVAAFAVALALHAVHLGQALPGDSSLEKIELVARKRMMGGQDTAAVARGACESNVDSRDPGCVKRLVESLDKNLVLVIGRYLSVPEVAPWLTSPEYQSSEELKERLSRSLSSLSLSSFGDAMRSAPTRDRWHYVGRLVNLLLFWGLLATTAFLLIRRPGLRRELLPATLLAVAAPLSWFVLAKGHSAVHVGLNTVLWSLPLLPFCLLLISRNWMLQKSGAGSRALRSAPAAATPERRFEERLVR